MITAILLNAILIIGLPCLAMVWMAKGDQL